MGPTREVTVWIDKKLFSSNLCTSVRELELNFVCENHPIEYTIAWSLSYVKNEEFFTENHPLVAKVVEKSELVKLWKKNSLENFIDSTSLSFGEPKRTITLLVVGGTLPLDLTALFTVKFKVDVWIIKDSQNLADYIKLVSNAIEQKDAKLSKKLAFESIFHVDSLKNGTVRITADGGGIRTAWRQALSEFPRVSADMAEAIVNEYPTPALYMQALKRQETEQNRRNLLSDIEVRRGFGVLQSIRRIGPELSSKIYSFFSSVDPYENI